MVTALLHLDSQLPGCLNQVEDAGLMMHNIPTKLQRLQPYRFLIPYLGLVINYGKVLKNTETRVCWLETLKLSIVISRFTPIWL